MNTDKTIVLAMQGAPPTDFPKREMDEFLALRARLERASPAAGPGYARYTELEKKLRDWPRTEDNDPYQAASLALARELAKAMGCEVLVGFDEFCAPSLDEALDYAAASGTETVLVVPATVTPGGEHSERRVPAAVSRARERYPGKRITYAWPLPVADVAAFLAAQLALFSSPDRA
jgi:sirohydrochlorin cobaltochelatase